MYERYCAQRSPAWKFELLSASHALDGGLKEAVALVTAPSGGGGGGGAAAEAGPYGLLRHESGVHRVQRVPATETQGRVHTSTASVAVMPEAEDGDVELRECDVRVDTYRSSGAGGQHVNTTCSAVRVTHVPTGTVVAIQDERSQHRNRAKAMKVLRSRLFDAARAAGAASRSAERRALVGSADRSERIRTYNAGAGRVKDHRCGLVVGDAAAVLAGDRLAEFLHAMQAADRVARLASLEGGAGDGAAAAGGRGGGRGDRRGGGRRGGGGDDDDD